MTQLKNQNLSVNINDNTLAVKVMDSRNRHIWTTPKSGIAIRVYFAAEESYLWYTPVMHNNPCEIRILEHDAQDNTIEYQLNFLNIGISFSVIFSLANSSLKIEIPKDKWNFQGETFYELLDIDIMPMFGAQPKQQDGYLVLPHGGGSLCYFTPKVSRSKKAFEAIAKGAITEYAHTHMDLDLNEPQMYASMIYGEQKHWRDSIWFPLWGTILPKAGYAAYLPFNSGDADASVVTTTNQGVDKLSSAYCRFHYRHHFGDEPVNEDRICIYEFLDGSERNLTYADIGVTYRQYLINKEKVSTLREKASKNEQIKYLASAYLFRPLLSLKRHKPDAPNLDGQGILDVYMTLEDLETDLCRLNKQGVEKAVVQLVGCNSQGHDGAYPDIFPIEPAVGGEEGLSAFISKMIELGFKTSAHLNLRCYSRNANGFQHTAVMKDRNGNFVPGQIGPMGEDFHACPYAALPPFKNSDFPRLKAIGLDGGIYFDFVLGVLFRCFNHHHGHNTTRRAYLDGVKQYLEEGKQQFGSVRIENAIAPILDTISLTTTIPEPYRANRLLQDSEFCQRGLVDEHVPLASVIYHGLVLYCSSNTTFGYTSYATTSFDAERPWDSVLNNTSIGAFPIDEFRGSSPQWDSLHCLVYEKCCKALAWLQYEFINDIKQQDELSCTYYSDGTLVWVNFSLEEQEVDDYTIPAKSFLVVTPQGEKILVTEPADLREIEPAPMPDCSRINGPALTGAESVSRYYKQNLPTID